MIRAIMSLVKDKNTESLSIGRILLWLTFFFLAFHWVSYTMAMSRGLSVHDAPESLVMVFVSLLAYIVFQKGKEVWKHSINIREGKIITSNKENK